MRFAYALVAAGVVVAAACGAPPDPGSVIEPTATVAATAAATAADTTTTTAAEVAPSTTEPPATVPTPANDPTTTTLPISLPTPPPSSATDPPRVVAAPGPPFEDASCRGEIVGTFTYVDGSTAAVRASATDFCLADGSAGMTVPYLPPTVTPMPYVGVSADGWLGSFAVVALPDGFPAAFTVWRDDGTEVPAVLGADGRSLLVLVSDSVLPTGHGELTFKTPDGTIFAVTVRP